MTEWSIASFDSLYIEWVVIAPLASRRAAIGASIACLGNIGPGWGSVGPAQTYSTISNSGLWGLDVLMLLGRLELFTVLVLCNPKFWQR